MRPYNKKLSTEIKRSLAKVLEDQRTKRGISKKELAEKSGLHRNEISYLERGKRVPTLETVIKIADGLDMEANEFMNEFFKIFEMDS